MAVRVTSLIKNYTQSGGVKIRPEVAIFLERADSVLIDKNQQMRLAWCCIAAGGHLLIEDLPGMGKTTMVKLLAKLFNLPWKRIQCTSDLLPADITGGNVYDDSANKFRFIKGPLFANLVMADELNRASPKSQSAFLQAMEESQVTVDGETYVLPEPFIVIATQNALDSAGTNPLPESQLDRFMMSISLGLPGRDSEKRLLMEPPRANLIEKLEPVYSSEKLNEIRFNAGNVHVGDRVADYILDLCEWIRARANGLSPRTVLALTASAKAWAFADGRDFVMPADVQSVAHAVLCHRLTPRANLDAKQSMQVNTPASIVAEALASVEVLG